MIQARSPTPPPRMERTGMKQNPGRTPRSFQLRSVCRIQDYAEWQVTNEMAIGYSVADSALRSLAIRSEMATEELCPRARLNIFRQNRHIHSGISTFLEKTGSGRITLDYGFLRTDDFLGLCPLAKASPNIRFRLHSPMHVPIKSPKPPRPKKVSLSSQRTLSAIISFMLRVSRAASRCHRVQDHPKVLSRWRRRS